jgi:signal transduction histidine kinase
MDRRQPSRRALSAAALVVVASLAALIVLPLTVTQMTESYRADNEKHAEPARAALNGLSYRISQQMAALTRLAATGDERHRERYRRAIELEEAALTILSEQRGAMGPEFDTALAELQHRLAAWHVSVQRSRDLQQVVFDENYPAVVEASHHLDEAITRYQTGRRQQVRRLTYLQLWLTVGLVVLAAVAASIVVWMVRRLRTLATMLATESSARQAALERQEELVRIRDEILGIVAHDLRSPLATIALSTQLIPGSPPDEQTEHVETIVATTRRMERLIHDLLEVTKLENKKLSIRREVIEPAAVAQEVIASHEPIAASKQIEFRSSVERSLPKISGDADRLAQALGNLLGNALKFTPAGGEVRLAVTCRDGTIRFAVSDNGPGIAPGDLPHLFEPFWQAKKTAHLGAGLGLKITRAIAEAHDGALEVTNLPDGGACFALDVPACG